MRLDLERAIAEPFHLLQLRCEVMITVVRPPAIDACPFNDREVGSSVERIQGDEIVAFRCLEDCLDRGDDLLFLCRTASAGLILLGSIPCEAYICVKRTNSLHNSEDAN